MSAVLAGSSGPAVKGRAPGVLRMVPGLTDSDAYLVLWERASPAFAGPFSVAQTLRRAAQFKAAADLMIVRGIRDAREAGYTWDQIGQELGMTRQGAQQLLARAKPELF